MVNPKMIIGQSGSNIYIHLLMNQSQLWWSSYHNILYYRFEIEEEALIISPQDEEQPTYINEAFTFLAKDKWIKVIEEELESMKSNQVWKLVNLTKKSKQAY
jgi:hypothetical protein